MNTSQAARSVLMVRPARPGSNPETATTNAFQSPAAGPDAAERVLAEFDGLAERLEAAGLHVVVWQDTPETPRPDAHFPNNWISFHADGTVVLYPLLAPSRRREVRPELVDWLVQEHGFQVNRVIDLRRPDDEDFILEGTGSLVLDRPRRVAYACLSPRTRPAALEVFAQQLDYSVVAFDAVDGQGTPVYHTNVLMALGEDFALLGTDTIRSAAQRQSVLDSLHAAGHDVIELSLQQLACFAGNALALQDDRGQPLCVLSERARGALTPRQLQRLEQHARLVCSPLDTVETLGGGSARCMLAALHLPRRADAPPLRSARDRS